MRKIQNKWPLALILALCALYFSVNLLRAYDYALSYQGSPSMPEGWYVLIPLKKPLTPNEIVAFKPGAATEAYLIQQHWLAPGTLLMKHVYALPGDVVCIHDDLVWINDKKTVRLMTEYAPGKVLPKLLFCRKLKANEYWLMSNRIYNSFDSRYFGPVPINNIVAKALPI